MAAAPHAFLSCTRLDDEFHGGAITALRRQLELGVRVVTGDRTFTIFQDVEGIAFGEHWPSSLDEALASARFMIPVLSPSFFTSEPCCAELRKFLAHERAANRRDLILPIYFVTIRELERQKRANELVRELSERQWEDWHFHADLAADDPRLRVAIKQLAEKIADRLAGALQ